jgi:hypothetical protein
MKSLSHSSTWFVTSTVRSGKKPPQYIQAPDHVGVACVTTTQALEHCPIAVSPIGMTTAWASLTGVRRSHGAKMNTVHFTGPFKPTQPVPICPSTDRTPNIFTQSAFEFRFIVQIFKSFYDNTIHVFEMVEDLFYDLIHTLFEGTSRCLLSLGALPTPYNPFNDRFDIQTELMPRVSRSKGINPCVYSYGLITGPFRSYFYLVSELSILVGNDIRIETFAMNG